LDGGRHGINTKGVRGFQRPRHRRYFAGHVPVTLQSRVDGGCRRGEAPRKRAVADCSARAIATRRASTHCVTTSHAAVARRVRDALHATLITSPRARAVRTSWEASSWIFLVCNDRAVAGARPCLARAAGTLSAAII